MALDHGIGIRIPAFQPDWKSQFSEEKQQNFGSAELFIIKQR